MKQILKKIRNWFLPAVKKRKNYTVYRIPNNNIPTAIFCNFKEIEKIPSETKEIILMQTENLEKLNVSESNVETVNLTNCVKIIDFEAITQFNSLLEEMKSFTNTFKL